MRNVTSEFLSAMKSRAYTARIALDNGSVIQGEAVKSIEFHAGSNSTADVIAVGTAVAASVEILLNKNLVDVAFSGRKVHIDLGFDINGTEQWLPMGTYKVYDAPADDGILTVKALDELANGFETEYLPLAGFDFATGVSSKTLLEALCERRGVVADTDGLEDIVLLGQPPEGCTERQLLGWIAALYGKFIVIDRAGVLRLRWYSPADINIAASDYYDGALKKAEYDFTVGWISCYSEITEDLFTEGDLTAPQGISFECPWMSAERLSAIWQELQGFHYQPVKGLRFFGDPRIDPGDIITVISLSGESFAVPVMSVRHEFDGGVSTEVSAAGQAGTTGYQGPVQRALRNEPNKAVNRQSQEDIFNKLTGGGKEQGVYLFDGKIYINASYLKAGVIEGIEIIGEKGTIGGFTLSGNTLSAEYRKDFPDYTQEDLTAITEVFMNWNTYTPEEQAAYLERYDVNMDGRVTSSDAVAMSSIVHGLVPGYTQGRIVLDAANPWKNLRIEVTGGYRAGESVTVGLGGVTASRLSADSFDCGGRQGYTGEITLGNTTLTVHGGIITDVK